MTNYLRLGYVIIFSALTFIVTFSCFLGSILLYRDVVGRSKMYDRKFEKKILHYENYCLDTRCISIVCVIDIENGYHIYHDKCPFIKNSKSTTSVYVSNYDNTITKYEQITNEQLMKVIDDYEGYKFINCDEDKIDMFCYNYHDNYLELYNKTNNELIIFNGVPLEKEDKSNMLINTIIMFIIELASFIHIIQFCDSYLFENDEIDIPLIIHFEYGITLGVMVIFWNYFKNMKI